MWRKGRRFEINFETDSGSHPCGVGVHLCVKTSRCATEKGRRRCGCVMMCQCVCERARQQACVTWRVSVVTSAADDCWQTILYTRGGPRWEKWRGGRGIYQVGATRSFLHTNFICLASLTFAGIKLFELWVAVCDIPQGYRTKYLISPIKSLS